LNKDHLFLH